MALKPCRRGRARTHSRERSRILISGSFEGLPGRVNYGINTPDDFPTLFFGRRPKSTNFWQRSAIKRLCLVSTFYPLLSACRIKPPPAHPLTRTVSSRWPPFCSSKLALQLHRPVGTKKQEEGCAALVSTLLPAFPPQNPRKRSFITTFCLPKTRGNDRLLRLFSLFARRNLTADTRIQQGGSPKTRCFVILNPIKNT